MAHVASEMMRAEFEVPLIIGGTTTSKIHTAAKVAGEYRKLRDVARRVCQRVLR